VQPHDARRLFTTQMLRARGDYGLVSELTGHKSLQTVATYDRRSQDEALAAVRGWDPLSP
jgi:integrase